jgi:8-oxo-dGTP pyrophosphatase MutT (NUDIX family)
MARTRQVAALPWRQRNGDVEFLLVTTRTTRRWVIPKGWPMDDRADHQAAEQEALEEAGIVGHVAPLPMGQFNYLKVADSGRSRMLKVDVYPLHVTDELENWMEKLHRERRWVSRSEAIAIAGEPELVGIFRNFDAVAADVSVAHSTPQNAGQGPSVVAQVMRWLKGGPRK